MLKACLSEWSHVKTICLGLLLQVSFSTSATLFDAFSKKSDLKPAIAITFSGLRLVFVKGFVCFKVLASAFLLNRRSSLSEYLGLF